MGPGDVAEASLPEGRAADAKATGALGGVEFAAWTGVGVSVLGSP